MPNALRVFSEVLTTPGDRLLADDDCCCPDCEICADNMARAKNANINTGAPVTYAGDVASFYVSGSSIRTATANEEVTVCDGDRVTVAVSTTVTGNQAYVKLGSLKGIVTFGATPKLRLEGGLSSPIEINAPNISAAGGTWLTLCVGSYQGQIGVMLYASQGNYRIFDRLSGTYAPNTDEFGTAGFGSGTMVSGEVIFRALKVQHGRGTGDLASCPECVARPCFLCNDDLSNFPAVSTTMCGWTIVSGDWENGLTADPYATLSASDVFTTGGGSSDVVISATVSFTNNVAGDAARIYLNGSYGASPSGYFVELQTANNDTGDAGCIRLMHGATELATSHWYQGGFPTTVTVYFGSGIFAVAPAQASVEGILHVEIPLGQPWQTAIGSGEIDVLDSEGIFYSDVTIRRFASGTWPYCEFLVRECAVFFTPWAGFMPVSADPIDAGGCTFTTLAGHVYTNGDGELLMDEAGSWVRFNVPHPTGKPGGYAHFVAGYGADSLAFANTWRIGWNAGGGPPGDYLQISVVPSADKLAVSPPPRYCSQGVEDLDGGFDGAFVKYELFLGGTPYGTVVIAQIIPPPLDPPGFDVEICVGEGLVRVWSVEAQCPGDIFNVPRSYGFGNNYWAVGVDEGQEGFFSPTGKFNFQFSRTYETSPPASFGGATPSEICQACLTAYCADHVCAGVSIVPRYMKVVLKDIGGNGVDFDCADADCEPLNGIFFVPANQLLNHAGGGESGCYWHLRLPESGVGLNEFGFSTCQGTYGGLRVRWHGAVEDAGGIGAGVEVTVLNQQVGLDVMYAKVADLCSSFSNIDVPLSPSFVGDGPCTFSGSTCTVTAVYT